MDAPENEEPLHQLRRLERFGQVVGWHVELALELLFQDLGHEDQSLQVAQRLEPDDARVLARHKGMLEDRFDAFLEGWPREGGGRGCMCAGGLAREARRTRQPGKGAAGRLPNAANEDVRKGAALPCHGSEAANSSCNESATGRGCPVPRSRPTWLNLPPSPPASSWGCCWTPACHAEAQALVVRRGT